MKHLFCLNSLSTHDIKLYAVEAESEKEAKKHFVKAFFPHCEVSFEKLVDGLLDGLDLGLAYLGLTSKIQEL